MHLTNIVSGAAFRVAALSLGVFIAILSVTGYALYHLVGATMIDDLEAQISEETILFQGIYERGGQSALVEMIGHMEHPALAGPRVAALYDEQGKRLAGNISVAPSFVGWRTLSLEARAPGAERNVHLHSIKLETSMLVVGRSTRFIDAVLERLIISLALAGLCVVLISLLIGYLSSRHAFVKLERMADSLDAVSRGDMRARVPVDDSNDQIDRVSRKINAHLDQLAALVGSTRNTVSAIAHDLRTPLNRTYMRLQEALAKGSMDQTTASLVEDAGAELTAFGEMIDTILRIARIEGSNDKHEFTLFSPQELVTDIAEIFQPIIEEAGQSLSIASTGSSDMKIYGDRRMLRQMLVNLLENAIRHCPAETRISMTSGATAHDCAVLCVEDNGPGIAKQYRQQVFDPFFRLDASRSLRGSGLGLTLVKAIAARHDASVAIEANEPGLRIVIAFPPVPARRSEAS